MSVGSANENQLLEVLCRQLYESTAAEQRAAAERALAEFADSADCLSRCTLLLETGSSPYAYLVASTTLTKLISKPSSPVTLQERIELRNYLLRYLGNQCEKLPPFVVNSLCQLFARLTKLGWFDFTKAEEYVFRDSIDELLKLAEQSVEYCTLCVQILAFVVSEISQYASWGAVQPQALGSITRHRKVAASFRDTHLYDIFLLAVKCLEKQSAVGLKSISSDASQSTLVANLLQLSISCVSFDFIGSLMDDTSDENVSVQIPTHWRIVFSESGLLKLFFSLYSSLPSDLSVHALTCLVQLASVRRTIFNNNERQQYLTGLVEGTKSILENPQKLSDRSNYHEFCRLIARLKSNYQLSELIRIDDYGKVIRALTEFTVQSLQMYQFSSNSIHYLLSFWQRMVVSVPYVKSNEQHSLDQFAPLIAKAYIDSRLALVSAVVNFSDGLEDPFDDHSSLGQQLDQLSAIMRCEYDKTCQLLVSHFDGVAAQYELTLKSIGLTQLDNQTRIQQGQLTWLVYLIGAAIGGRAALGSAEDHDGDGELVCRVLRLMVMSDEKLSRQTTALPASSTQTVGCEKMEFAFLWHLEQFRKIYISDQVQKTSKVYNKLAESFNLNDESQVLAVYVRKIITNLKYWGDKERLVDETLTLLNDLCVGYTSVRKLVRLDETRFMLNNHTSAEFSFLGTGGDPSKSRCRTTFYTALTRLLSVELNDDETGFYSFMLPIEEAKTKLAQALQLLNGGIGSQEETKRAVVGLVRDLRGVAFASNTKTSYSMLFDLLYPDYFEIFRRAIEIWYIATELTSPVLKLMNELCHNRSQRLQFDMSSANAVLLFREASKLICAYGSRILSLSDVSKERQYKVRLKGISICFGILKSALSGGYLNFGVFRLYEDSCLEDALNMAVRLLLVIPQGELLSYSKLSQNYYYMLECLAQDHCAFLSHLEKDIFTYLLQTLHDGLTAVENGTNSDTVVVTGSCSTLDLLITYVYRRLNKPLRSIRTRVGLPPDGNNCLEAVKQRPETLRQILSTILHVVMFEECRAQWSMSRPLLGLILLQEEDFAQVRLQAVSTQPSNKHQALEECFATLMEGVERNLTVKNKDRFTQNLSVFRRNVADILKYSAAGSGTLTAVASSVDMVS